MGDSRFRAGVRLTGAARRGLRFKFIKSNQCDREIASRAKRDCRQAQTPHLELPKGCAVATRKFVLAFAAALFSFSAAGADPGISIPVQITHAQNYDPSPSPDGKKLVFISMISGKEQLFTMDVDGKNISQLTRDDADHEDPAWSPDGKKIAFVRITKERTSIAVMDADGGNVEILTPKEQNTIHPNWSADSKRIIYCTNDDLQPPKKNRAQINAIDLATKKITPLITDGINTYGSWSPDMKQIVFRKIIGEENSEVFLAAADGSNLRNLTNNPFFDGWPAWSPDGKKIAFASNRRGYGYQIFVMDADGSHPRLVANTEGRGTAPRWSPDGKVIYFTNCVAKDYGSDCEILRVETERLKR
jgi:TolB protein